MNAVHLNNKTTDCPIIANCGDDEGDSSSILLRTSWKYNAKEIIRENNRAVFLIREGRYREAQLPLRSALIRIQREAQGSSIMLNRACPVVDDQSSNCPISQESPALIDDWMKSSSQAALYRHDSSEDSSFFLYKEGISIPTLVEDSDNEAVDSHYKAFAFCVFFNQGLAHHLCCNENQSPKGRKRMATSAHMLYRIAMQYHHEHTRSSFFLLAVCNNLAVLDLQWSSVLTSDRTGRSYFAYQHKLLVNSFLAKTATSCFTIKETALRNKYWENVLRAKDCFSLRSHAGAA